MTGILIAIGVLFGIALVMALILSLSSYFFTVPRDEKIDRIRESLPGANCGACGYTGCDGYAEAIASGEAKTNLCVPGGSDVAKAISDICGVECDDVEKVVAFVQCNGTESATEWAAGYDGLKTCAAMCLSCGGPGKCKRGCLGCGDCVKVCPVNAICLDDGIARINPDICIGCGACVKACPKHIISTVPQSAKVAVICSNHDLGAVVRKKCKAGCIACRKCEKTCKYGAITVVNNLAVIDYSKCVGCGECYEACPVHCIAKTGEFNIEYRKKDDT